jgi:thiol:disulfide interchange protein DsbD
MHGTEFLAHGWLIAFASAFGAGFLTSLTPCVYPLIPITVSIFGARKEKVSRVRALGLAAAYVSGMGAMYAGLGVVAAFAGNGFGKHLASPFFVIPIALFFLAMAASMFGAFELSLPSEVQAKLTSIGGEGPVGAFGMGLVGGIIAAPCTGPPLASILAYVATTRSVALGASLLFTYALGMGVLFFLIAAFAVSLPKSGAWMDTVKSLFGVVMVVAALYFLKPIAPWIVTHTTFTKHALAIAIALAVLGVAVGGLHLSFHHTTAGVKLRKALGVLLLVAGLWQGVIFALTPRETRLVWGHDEASGVAIAKRDHKPAILDFFADYCIPCKELDLKVFSDPAVAAEMERFQLVKVDNSKNTDEDNDRMNRYDAATLPTVVLIDSSGKIVERVRKVLEPEEFLEILRRIH